MALNPLYQWFDDWNIPPKAIDDLINRLTAIDTVKPMTGRSEEAVKATLRLEASEHGSRLWVNNVGACQDKTGRLIRYGLANTSKQVNGAIKSADLIGIKPVTITPDMVGAVVGVMLSRECKKGDWHWTGTEHEQAQLAWAVLILALHGDAAIVNGSGSL